MTVFYKIGDGGGSVFGGFANLLFRWRGSIFKLMWPDLTIFLLAFYTCSVTYRYLLNPHQQRLFEQFAAYCEKYGNLIPVSFVLGFYVSIVVSRWWAQYKTIPWIDTMALWVNSVLPGDGESERMYRRTIMRYMVLAITQCFTLISPTVKKRFPTHEHYITAGLLTVDEKRILEDISSSVHSSHQLHWIPFIWAGNLIMAARAENKIKVDTYVRALLDEINKTKDKCNRLLDFDRICIPLVYTQVVTMAVYSYFLSCVMGRQWLYPQANSNDEKIRDSLGEHGSDDLDLVVPLFTILQFFFYMGWLKVAETLVNPFGEDDNDFELQWMVDRSLMVAYMIVDEIHKETPKLVKDIHWNTMVPLNLPHTKSSIKFPYTPPAGTTADLVVDRIDSHIIAGPEIPIIDEKQCEQILQDPKSRRGFARELRRKFIGNTSKNCKTGILSWIRSRRKETSNTGGGGRELSLNVLNKNRNSSLNESHYGNEIDNLKDSQVDA